MVSSILDTWSEPRARSRLADLVDRAGVEILALHSHADYEAGYTEHFRPMMEPDFASHDILIEGLQEASDLPLISKESKPPAYATRKDWSRHWVVNGLGGMRGFIQKTEEFTVEVALVEEGEPVLGIVHAPEMQLTYWGARGEGAWRRHDDGDWERVTPREIPDRHLLKVVVSHRDKGPELDAYLARLPAHEIMEKGGGLKFGVLAEGAADLHPGFGDTWEWDTAAGHAILEAAGGVVRDVEGRPVGYNKKEMRNPRFVAAGDAGWFA